MVHPFERAGLGKAPFRYLGTEERRGPIKMEMGGATVEVGSPGQPMGTCAYCSQGIALCCMVRSADGREFMVGSDCIRKLGAQDKPLIRAVQRDARKASQARELERIQALLSRFPQDKSLQELLAQTPAPKPSISPNALEWVSWMLDHAGHAGMLRVVRFIDKLSPNT